MEWGAPVAQRIEHPLGEGEVAGSNPAGGTQSNSLKMEGSMKGNAKPGDPHPIRAGG